MVLIKTHHHHNTQPNNWTGNAVMSLRHGFISSVLCIIQEGKGYKVKNENKKGQENENKDKRYISSLKIVQEEKAKVFRVLPGCIFAGCSPRSLPPHPHLASPTPSPHPYSKKLPSRA
jgi:hypothetical protein